MPKYTFIGNDAQGSDPEVNPELVVSIFDVVGKRIMVPASLVKESPTPAETDALEAAIYSSAGIDPNVALLYDQWEVIKAQSASRPLGTMTLTEAKAWVDANVTNIATAQTALKNIATELFIIRAQMRIIEALFRNLFDA